MSESGNPVNEGVNVMCVLAAHAAARAMARRGAGLMLRRSLPRAARLASIACCRRPAWTPLLLRWARKAMAARSGGAMRAPALPAKPSVVFHWHLHLALVSGSDRALREARPAALAGRPGVRAQADSISRPGAGRLADSGDRRPGGPASTLEGVGAMRPLPQPAGIDRVRFAMLAHSERTLHMFHWLGRASAHARYLHGDADSRPAQPPPAPKEPSLRIGGPLLPGAPALGQTRVAWRGAARGRRPASPLMAPPSPISAPAAMPPSSRSLYPPPQAGSKNFLQHTHSQETRTLLWARRATPATRAFDSAPGPAARYRHDEHGWRASNTVGAATASSGRMAPPGTVARIAVRRPLDLVWSASPAAAAAAGHAARLVGAGETDVLSARPMPAVAQAPAGVNPASAGTVIRADALDPALANRLADEVMRRIDHRARIERERRGL